MRRHDEARNGVTTVQNNMTQSAVEPRDLRPAQAGRLWAAAGQILIVGLLGVAFFLAPALQGISLEADQSAGANAATRAADAAASAEVIRLTDVR